MSHYTTQLKTLIDTNYPLGLTDYPIFDETYRASLNKKIKDHFMFREIGFETPALFVWYLNVKMREIMPLYNQYYTSALIAFNPLHNVDLTESSKKETAGTSESSGESLSEQTNTNNSDSRNIHSDTPQGMLALDDLKDSEHTYASDADTVKASAVGIGSSKNNITNSNEVNSVDDYLKTVQGNNGSKSNAELIIEYRKTFINTDTLVLKELDELFMGVW